MTAAAAAVVLALAACQGGTRANPVLADGTPTVTVMSFDQALRLDALPEGWWHRTFFRTPPMQARFGPKEGRQAIRLATEGGGSMLFRRTDLPVDDYPFLRWGWLVERAVASDVDETTRAGDDHPARLYLKFRSASGEEHAMEIIWGNRRLGAGDWKYLDSPFSRSPFPHYVARGGDANVGRWFDESVDLRALYRKSWGDPAGARLVDVALFCDTDATGASSVAYFSRISLARK